MRKRILSAKATRGPKSIAEITPEELRQVMSQAMRKSKSKFTPEEVRWFGQQLREALCQRLISPPPDRGKTEMFPSWPSSARGRKLDPRVRAAWNDWEMGPHGKKPSYRSLALRYFGRADCPACGGKKTISFGTFNVKRSEWWLRQNRRTGDCYCCNRCKTPYLRSDAQTGRLCCDLPEGFPVPVSDTALTLSKLDSNSYTLSLKKLIPRLHRHIQERTNSPS